LRESIACVTVVRIHPSQLVKLLFIWCVVSVACVAEAVSPTLSISRVPPATLQFSWPSNFTDWKLTTTTNPLSSNWQPVSQTPVPSGNLLLVLFPFTNLNGFFRLEQTNGSCVFQAVPPLINSGASSTLSWCPVGGVTYRVSPGPGIVAGGNLIVSPTVTTVYTLTASNALGVVTNFATVIVNPCGFSSVTNWNATLNFSYTVAPSAPGFSFNVHRSAQATFHLTRSDLSGGNALFVFDGSATGTVSINDREDDSSSGTLITSTTIGVSPPVPFLSAFVLSVNCSNATYNFAAIVAVDAIDTTTSLGTSDSSPRTGIAGQVTVVPRPLPVAAGTLSGSGNFPVLGPFTIPSGDYYVPNDFIANDMWIDGALTDVTAGTASVSWSIAPAP
jgi:hypothetical protein